MQCFIVLSVSNLYFLKVINGENGNMTWVPTNVNIDDHVIVPELDPNMESSDKFVNDYISNLSRSQIENSKPLWDIHILNTRTLDAQSTLIFRIHHSIGDGISLMNFMLGGSRKASDNETLPKLHGNKVSGLHIKITNVRTLIIILWNSIVALVMFILTAFVLKDTKTPLKSSRGVEDTPRRFVHRTFRLEDIKLVKRSMDTVSFFFFFLHLLMTFF